MDGIRQWIMSVAGLMVVAGICDVIMPEGEMKKYIKPILGFVLMFTLIRPLGGGVLDKINISVPSDYDEVGSIVWQVEQTEVKAIYQEKLEDKAEEYLRTNFDLDCSVKVGARGGEENFGEITQIEITGDIPNTSQVEELAKEFGVDSEIVRTGGE